MSYEIMFQKALLLQQNGALNEAEQIYRQILQSAPHNADVLNMLGLIAQTKGLHSEAVSYFYQAAQYAPKHFPIYFNLATSLEALGKHLEAIEAFQKVLTLNNSIKEAHFAIANIYWFLGKTQDAAKEYEKALTIDENYVQAAANLADMQNDEAKLKDLCQMHPNSPIAFFYLARRSFDKNEFNTAEELLQKADKLTSSDEIKAMLAQCFYEQKKYKQALQTFYAAVNLNCRNINALLGIADLEAFLQNFVDAEKYYKKTIETDAKNFRAHVNYANMLCQKNRLLEALEEYRQAVLLDPDNPAPVYNLALILKDLKDYEQALNLMFQAYYADTSQTRWAINIAQTIVLYYRIEPQKAKKIAQNWYEKMPQNLVCAHLWHALNGKTDENNALYNQLLFDSFAESYENVLQKIEYNVVNKIKSILQKPSGKILDLGCGTGMLGKSIANENNQIYGVDISANMLKKAKEKNVYKQLVNADIIQFLQNNKVKFDLIAASDVFCYFADLLPLISLCRPASLIFSVETNNQTSNYFMQPNGRISHNLQYVAEILHQCGYSNIKQFECVLRHEDNNQVFGCIFYAKSNK